MKRTLAAAFAAAIGVGGMLWADPLSATSDNSPHSGPGAHAHHVYNESGCHDVQSPDMGGSERGTHRAALNNGAPSHDGMHHGTCQQHATAGLHPAD